MLNAGPTGTTNDQITMVSPQLIHWLFYKLGLKFAFCLGKIDGISHFAEHKRVCNHGKKTIKEPGLLGAGRAAMIQLVDSSPIKQCH